MKYKTLFRTGLKLLGVYFIGTGIATIITYVVQIVSAVYMGRGAAGFPSWQYFFVYGTAGFFQLGFGLYLFFGGRWIADKAIASNRPYCHECGYDVSYAVGAVCNECGTAFPKETLERIKAIALKRERKVL